MIRDVLRCALALAVIAPLTALVTQSEAQAAPFAEPGCYILGWTGGAAGGGVMEVRSRLSVTNDGKNLRFGYDWKNGVIELKRTAASNGEATYAGTWKQDGSTGGAGMVVRKGELNINGFWSGASGAKQAMSARKCPEPQTAWSKQPLAPGCYTLSWTGGAAGGGVLRVKSKLTVNKDGSVLSFPYEWKGGTMRLKRVSDNGSKAVYRGTWKQKGSTGGAGLTFVPGKSTQNGYWSGSAKKKHGMSIRKCGT